jgi:N-acetylglutamate synthase-like GNAT family acetyltransferase
LKPITYQQLVTRIGMHLISTSVQDGWRSPVRQRTRQGHLTIRKSFLMTDHPQPPDFLIRPMLITDYDEVLGLLSQTPGVSLREADSREATARYLTRNPELSFVAEHSGVMAGCVMSGHDGRRGYLQHLAVLPDYRRSGIASSLVEQCLVRLEQEGISKTHIDVLKTKPSASAYWKNRRWTLRTDIERYSLVRSGKVNA